MVTAELHRTQIPTGVVISSLSTTLTSTRWPYSWHYFSSFPTSHIPLKLVLESQSAVTFHPDWCKLSFWCCLEK